MSEQTPHELRALVPTDGSDVSKEALPPAQAILGGHGSLTLLAVLPDQGTNLPYYGFVGENLEELDKRSRKNALRELNDLASTVTTHMPEASVETAIERGDPAETIIRFAADHEFDLIVMSTHGRGTMGRFAYGSVADRVARTAPIPVLLVRSSGNGAPTSFNGFQRILLLLDTSNLSAESVPVVQRLATLLELPVALLTVIDPSEAYEPLFGYATYGGEDIYAGVLQAARDDAAAAQSRASETLEAAGVKVQPMVVDGQVVPAILQAVRPGDLIVMTSHGRSGLKRWVLGSIAEKVLRSASAPLLLVHLPTIWPRKR